MTLRLVVVDDHPVVRDGLAGIFESEKNIEVVGQAGNGSEAMTVIDECKPDLVLMDLRMPSGDGFTAIRELREKDTRIRILVLTTYDSERDIRRAMAAGANGYLLKDLPREQLIQAVLSMMTKPSAAPAADLPESHLALTDREIEVLGLVADGLTNRAVARKLGISEATVKTHLTHIYPKLNVPDRAAAVREAWEQGLV